MPLTFILSYDSHDRQVKVTYSADKNPTTQRSQRACSSSHSCQGQRWLCTWTQVSLSSWPSALVTVPHDLPLSERPKVGSIIFNFVSTESKEATLLLQHSQIVSNSESISTVRINIGSFAFG